VHHLDNAINTSVRTSCLQAHPRPNLTLFSEFFSEQWEAAATACCDTLERNDLRKVSRISTLDDVQAQFPDSRGASLQSAALQEFAMLSRRLENLGGFVDFVSKEANPKVRPDDFWGGVGLTIKVSHLPLASGRLYKLKSAAFPRRGGAGNPDT
jgi:hypothetical protein